MNRNTMVLVGVGAVGLVWFFWRKKKPVPQSSVFAGAYLGSAYSQAPPVITVGSAVRGTVPMKPNPRDRKFCSDHCRSVFSYGKACDKRKCRELYPEVYA